MTSVESGVQYYFTKNYNTFQWGIDYCDTTFNGATMLIHVSAAAKDALMSQLTAFYGGRQSVWISYQIEVGELPSCRAACRCCDRPKAGRETRSR